MDAQDDYDGQNGEKYSDRDRKAKGSSKSKDLSHVPCKFFKVGSCTAGSSCPFSHNVLEPGQQKEICSWYIKGNCKFGHKCALAHVLPGQSMSMDRRNKKAAQQAATQGGREGGERGGVPKERERERDRNDKPRPQRPAGVGSAAASTSNTAGPTRGPSTQTRSGLLMGSTAPTRMLTAGARPPLPISKAVPAPAAPAPTLEDTDFASVDVSQQGADGSMDPENTTANTSTKEALGNAPSESDPKVITAESTSASTATGPVSSPHSKTPYFPLASPTQPVRFTGRHGSTPSVDFGPIGSPPRSSPAGANPTRINGFSPGTSPREAAAMRSPPIISGSPFSAPGGQSLFMPFERPDLAADAKGRSGLAMSLGATRTLGMGMGLDAMAQFGGQRSVSGPDARRGVRYEEDEDGDGDNDMEEFVPSSLKELLTPEEQSRRMSRASSGNTQAQHANAGVGHGVGAAPPSLQDSRFSRSVPAPSPLGDLKSIWAETRNDMPLGRPGGNGMDMLGNPGIGLGHGQSLAVGSPSSFNSSGFARTTDGPSPSLLSPSNASAAFLPGLHHHYLSRPTGGRSVAFASALQQQPSERAFAGAGGILNGMSISPSSRLSHHPSDTLSTNHSIHDILSSSPSALQTHHAHVQAHHPHPHLSNSHLAQTHHASAAARPIPSKGFLPSAAGANAGADHLLSPSTRALQAHAPGQSLPQGLAAGYSRIHVQPPPNIPSPAAFSPGSVGVGMGAAMQQAGMDTFGQQQHQYQQHQQQQHQYQGMEWGASSLSGIGNGMGTPTSSSNMMSTGLPSAQTQSQIHMVTSVPPGLGLGQNQNSHQSAHLGAQSPSSRGTGTGTPPTSAGFDNASNGNNGNGADVGGLSTMFSRLSYSAAAARGTPAAVSPSSGPASMARKASGQRWASHPMSSPLSGPVLTSDDDVVFSIDMDEEK